jgi:hypothetical protein
MAKDFDFRRSARPSSAPLPPKPTVTAPIINDSKPSSALGAKPKKRGVVLPFVVALIIFGGAFYGLYAYYLTLQPPATSSAVSSASNVTKDESKQLTITVYDRGAGSDKSQSAIKALQGAGFAAVVGEVGSFTYAKSYIFYNKQFNTQAQQISQTLASYNLILKESPLGGISIYLAKE